MVLYFINRWPLLAIVGEYFQNEVLELIREVLASNLLPVVVYLA